MKSKISAIGSITMMLVGLQWAMLSEPSSASMDNTLEDLVEGLFDLQVVTASKRAERLIDAPTSISVITRAEIKASGSTSIAEALRLVPGVIVSEQRNGYYDINLRGFDLAPPDLPAHQTASKNLLVMVDSRVIYDQTWGTVPWHDISLAIDDLDRIEVVRGPSSALYGPNAFTGVIHIFSRRPKPNDNEPHQIQASVTAGDPGTALLHSAIDFTPGSEFWRARVSANIDTRERHQTTYYSLVNDRYQTVEERFPNNFIVTLGQDFDMESQFPDPKLANDRRALNFAASYDNDYGRIVDGACQACCRFSSSFLVVS